MEQLELGGKYFDLIQKIGGYQLTYEPTVKELGINRALTVAIYKEKDKINKNFSVVDYICYVATGLYQYINKQANFKLGMFGMSKEEQAKNHIKTVLRLFVKNPFYLLTDDFVKDVISNTRKELLEKIIYPYKQEDKFYDKAGWVADLYFVYTQLYLRIVWEEVKPDFSDDVRYNRLL